jgi:hypothetical protein
MERMLYVWALRHPASSYVQGMNDIVTPFFLLFLFEGSAHENLGDICKQAKLDTIDTAVVHLVLKHSTSPFADL